MQDKLRQKNGKVSVWREKITLIFSALLLLSATQAVSQTVIKQTIVPSNVISVGYNNEPLSVVIEHESALADGMTLSVTQPAGMAIDPAGWQVNGMATGFSTQGNTVTIAGPIAAGTTTTVTYVAVGTCAIVSDLYDPSDPIQIIDHLTVRSAGSVVAQASTDYYNVKYPDLLPSIPSINTMQVAIGQTYTRQFPVNNGDGAGTTDEVVLTVTDTESDQVLGERAFYARRGAVQVALPTPVKNGNALTYTIGSATLQALGLGSTFDGKESFDLVETFVVKYYMDRLETTYRLTWLVGGDACGTTRTTAYGAMYVKQTLVSTNLTGSLSMVQKPTTCETAGKARLTLTSNAPGNAYNVLPSISGQLVSAITKISYNGQALAFDADGKVTALPATDPTGVFTDIDGQGGQNDLGAGKTAVFDVEFTYPTDHSFNQNRYLSAYAYFDNMAGVSTNIGISNLYEYESALKGSASSPEEMLASQSTSFVLTYNLSKYGSVADSCNRQSYYMTLEVPEGVTIDASQPVMVGGVQKTATQVGNLITIRGTATEREIMPMNGVVDLKLVASCAAASGFHNFDWTVYGQCGTCDPYVLGTRTSRSELMGCDTATPGCLSMLAPHFAVKRLTLGFAEKTGTWYESDITAATPRVSASVANLKAALVSDTVLLSMVDTINHVTCQPTAYTVTFRYAGTANLFGHAEAVFSLNGTSISLDAPALTSDGDYNYITYSVPLSAIGGLDAGVVKVDAKMVVSTTAFGPGATQTIGRFRAIVGFVLDDVNYGIKSGNEQLTVYYPNIARMYANNSYGSVCGSTFSFYIQNNNNHISLPNEFRSMFHTSQVYVPLQAGVSYRDGSLIITYNGVALTGFTVTTTTNPSQLVIDGTWPILKMNETVNMSVGLDFLPTVENQWLYAYADTYEYDYQSWLLNNTSTTSRDDYGYLNVNKPVETISASEKQSGYSNNVTWDMTINKQGSSEANTWLAFANGEGNTAEISVVDVIVNGTAISTAIYTEGENLFVNLGTLVAGDNNVEVVASYANCGRDNTDTLYVTGGISCAAIETLAGAVSTMNDKLLLINKAADMQAEAWEMSRDSAPYDMCDTIIYQVKVNSSSLGYMYDEGFWIDMPEHLTVVGDVNYSYMNYTGIITDFINADNRILSVDILKKNNEDDGFPGLGSDDNTIILDIPMKLTCGKTNDTVDVSNPFSFFTKGKTNCGDLKVYSMPFTPAIVNFEKIDSIKILRSSGVDFAERHGEAGMSVTIKNNSNTLVDSVYMQAILPFGFEYVAGSTGPLAIEPYSKPSPLGTIMVWELPKGVYMAAYDSLTLNFKVRDITACPPATASIVVSTYLLRTVGGSCGDTCVFKGTTDIDTVTLNVKGIGQISAISGPDSVCQGAESLTYSVTADDEYRSFVWGVVPAQAGNIAATAKMATVTLNAAFVGTGNVWLVAATDSCPAADTLYHSFEVNARPVIDSLVAADSVLACDTIRVVAFGSVDSYSWTISPASAGTITANGSVATIVFDEEFFGYVEVEATATNGSCSTSRDVSMYVKICGCKVNANEVESVCAGTPVKLSATTFMCDEGNTGCATPDLSPLPCGTAAYSPDQNLTVNAGQTLYVQNYSKNVTMNGGTLVICGSSTNFTISGNPAQGMIVVNGTATFQNMNINTNTLVLKNYGKVTFRNFTANLAIENHDTMIMTQDYENKRTFLNKGVVNATVFNNTGSLTNMGTIVASTRFQNNGSSALINSCTISTAQFINDKQCHNTGFITVSGETTLNGGSTYTAGPHSLLDTRTLMFNGNIAGDAATCATIKVSQSALCNSSAVTGLINVCGITKTNNSAFNTKVMFNCSCSTSGASGLQYSWAPASLLQNATSATPTFTNPVQETTFTVTVIDAKGNRATDKVTVPVHQCSHVSVTPNPYTQYIDIKADATAASQATIYVINTQGQNVAQQTIQTNSTQRVWLNWLNTGNYTLTVVVNGEYTESINLIKQ